jgi:hypothetical protein
MFLPVRLMLDTRRAGFHASLRLLSTLYGTLHSVCFEVTGLATDKVHQEQDGVLIQGSRVLSEGIAALKFAMGANPLGM